MEIQKVTKTSSVCMGEKVHTTGKGEIKFHSFKWQRISSICTFKISPVQESLLGSMPLSRALV